MTPTDLREKIDAVPRVRLAHLPTPVEELPRLSEALEGPRIFIKRDDCTGLAFGGNKARHNEFILADALGKKADTFVWGAGTQSNNCRQTAAACARLGLDCHLMLSRAHGHDEIQGNLLLDHLLGASIELVDAEVGPDLDRLIEGKAERFRAEGRTVYNWNRGLVKNLAAVSYVLCIAEMADQLRLLDVEPSAVYVCSAGSTGAGMTLGAQALGLEWPVRIILPLRWPWDEHEDLARIGNETAELINIPTGLAPQDLDIHPDYIGEGYTIPTDEGAEAISLLARTEAILLDPTYTAKAMAALIDHVRQGMYAKDDAIMFLHTGGAPALFAYRDELVAMTPTSNGKQISDQSG
jgi:D-cysteine desulfhydrase family pyridoxal phosphate-dependent enzyme